MEFLHRSLKAKLLGLTTLTLAAAVLGLLVSVNIILLKSHRNAADESLKRTSFSVKRFLEDRLFDQESQAKLIGEIPILSTVLEGGNPNTIRDAAVTYRENLRVPVLDVLETNGALLASAGDAFLKDDTLPPSFIEGVLESGVGRCVYNSARGPILIALSIIGNSDEPDGILLIGRPLDSAFLVVLQANVKTDLTILEGDSVIASTLAVGEGWRENGGEDFATALLPLEDGKGGQTTATIALHHSLKEQRAVLFSLRAILLGVGGALFLISAGAAYRFSDGITRPLAEAVSFAHNLAGGNTGKAIARTRRDEIGTLQESLESMRVSLKGLLESLDVKIHQVTGMQRKVQNILDNLESGFLQFDSQGRIQPGYSRISEEFFGPNLEGKLLEEALLIDPKIWGSISSWREILFGGVLPFRDAASLGPARFERMEGRHIELAYRPVLDGEILVGVIMVATDKTSEQELILKSQREKERADMIVKISVDRDGFLDFVKDTKSMLAQLQVLADADGVQKESLEHLFRLFHTIKGNAAMYGVSEVRDIAHSLENELANTRSKLEAGIGCRLPNLQSGLVALEDSLEGILKSNRNILGEASLGREDLRRVTVPGATLERMEREMLTRFHRDSEMFRMFLDTFVLEPILPALKRFESVAISVADRRGKELKPIVWEGDLKVRLQCYKGLIASLVHGFRNAVDHGIEETSERIEAGKDSGGALFVEVSSTENSPSRLRISVRDDGRGIDPKRIREKAGEKRLLGQEALDALTDNEAIQLVFRNGFSTNEVVSDISGRGVGMDAILYEAKKLGGTAWIESRLGFGSALRIEVPFYADAYEVQEALSAASSLASQVS